jgi:hypothetical protein
MSGIGSVTSSVGGTVVQNAEQDTERNVKLLKKAMSSDKETVSQLLESMPQGRVDIRA